MSYASDVREKLVDRAAKLLGINPEEIKEALGSGAFQGLAKALGEIHRKYTPIVAGSGQNQSYCEAA